uniref:Uncharacterized protein n=1 Tax=Anguilla anguilla TaxID=7936 RepID=A0A0E9S9J0_ANGAN
MPFSVKRKKRIAYIRTNRPVRYDEQGSNSVPPGSFSKYCIPLVLRVRQD